MDGGVIESAETVQNGRRPASLAKELGGPLLTYNGDGHTAFLRSTCVNGVVSDSAAETSPRAKAALAWTNGSDCTNESKSAVAA